ncbi:DinB family protein [Methylobrevis pamukkalensis]|uniref:DinB family protein n=1 Tax=Methylobrevis pamukkalensis TaxID=1439726 RepID=A0A1E3H0U2_9HYPH|nr:DinB family protein [Methylobrevis pamukkalensis]ODN69191.1 DinB family protein [Methylobrevis pamukkalensis]
MPAIPRAGVAPEVDALEAPTALDQIVETGLADLRRRRDVLDGLFERLVAGLEPADLGQTLAYARMNGERQQKPLGLVLMHVFNHQTHHRGQTTTLMSQAGSDVGVTDLLALIPEAA